MGIDATFPFGADEQKAGRRPMLAEACGPAVAEHGHEFFKVCGIVPGWQEYDFSRVAEGQYATLNVGSKGNWQYWINPTGGLPIFIRRAERSGFGSNPLPPVAIKLNDRIQRRAVVQLKHRDGLSRPKRTFPLASTEGGDTV